MQQLLNLETGFVLPNFSWQLIDTGPEHCDIYTKKVPIFLHLTKNSSDILDLNKHHNVIQVILVFEEQIVEKDSSIATAYFQIKMITKLIV